ncbi:sulfotransferase family protein [Tunicatimonas pelagia]|uniref:sulfotransferase-like domain-containing protein n=1 Tax=Tunicatimonas pelagia TaxID=931531 RepID=UPI0026669C94|nr:sulfotransferase family protein [Tunicatimonas pelagia]WKN46210.1 sulfotransferase family protein [Tunicatimonas pelagia]
MKRVHLISNPRNLSTALMYSFAQRLDTRVVDEPFYGHYLTQRPEVDHPGKEQILSSMDTNAQEVLDKVIFSDYDRSVLFIKNMAHHFVELDHQFIIQLTNLFLIRNPKQLISSIAQQIPTPTMDDIGCYQQYKLYQFLRDLRLPAVVLDSGELLKDPPGVLRKLCEKLDVPFEEQMLSWEAKPLPEDGIWAKYWYRNIHQSTGFSRQPTSSRPLPTHLEELYEAALPFYNKLYENTIQA